MEHDGDLAENKCNMIFVLDVHLPLNPEKKITLRHLLSHTSGIAHEAPIGNNREASYLSFEEHVRSVSDTWLRYKVGEGYSYSNPAYALAAYVLQLRSGRPFAKYVEGKVLTPFNMSNCSVDPAFIKNHPNRAIGRKSCANRIPLLTDVPMIGAGGVYASAKDMARFVQSFLNRGKVDGQTALDESLIISMVTLGV